MLLYIIRHGEPDYKTDTLTEAGQTQAQALVERLCNAGIEAIYSSPMGRAAQTAAPTAAHLGLPVQIEPWAEELGRESQTPYPDGKMKNIYLVPPTALATQENRDISMETCLDRCPGLCENGFSARYHYVARGLDDLLSRHGYERDDRGFYRASAPNDRRIALFCHAGMSRMAISHLFNIPYQLVGAILAIHFTGITLVQFSEKAEAGEIIGPRLCSIGDIGHLKGYPQ